MNTDPLGLVGTLIGDKYLLEAHVGSGGFACVYRAQHTIWGRPVAVKLFSGLSSAPSDMRDELQQAFVNEGALLSELSTKSANIVQARDVGTITTEDGRWMPWVVLEWLEGRSLDEVIDADRRANAPAWPLDLTLRTMLPVIQALGVAHAAGVAHRDIKPGNIFVLGGDPTAPGCVFKVLDFGVAKIMSESTDMQAALAKTGTQISSFTPLYAAPEQFSRRYGATGPWTDVFAIALVMVELMSGRVALDGVDLAQLAVASSDPNHRPTPRNLGVPVPDAIEAVFAKAVAVSPQDRYANADELHRALVDAMTTSGITVSGLASSVMPAPTASRPNITPIASAKTVAISTTTPPATPSRAGLGVALGGAALLAVGAAVWLGGGAGSSTNGASSASAGQVSASGAPSTSAALAASSAGPPCPSDMVEIPPGMFFQGSDAEGALPNESPSHHVKLAGFCLDRTEVTVAAYKACSDAGGCRPAARDVDWPGIKPADVESFGPACNIREPDTRAAHPINCVDHDMATRFCTHAGKRLPTESEWEYAARGPDGRVYPWGDEPPTERHLNGCGLECVRWHRGAGLADAAPSPLYEADDGWTFTAPVGTFKKGASRFGPDDVSGNVWEWVSDWYGPYEGVDSVAPTGPSSGERRVIRGGAFNGIHAAWLRPSFRFGQAPTARSHGIGFRCAKTIPTSRPPEGHVAPVGSTTNPP